MAALTILGTPTLNGDSTCLIDSIGSDKVSCPQAQSLLDETQSWIAMRIRMSWASTGSLPGTSPGVFHWGDAAFAERLACWASTVNSFGMVRQDAAAVGPQAFQTATWAIGDLVTVIGKWTSAGTQISVKGQAFASTAGTDTPVVDATSFDIGNIGAGVTRQIMADVLWFACGLGVLLNADATTLQATDEITFGTLPVGADIKMIWTCDDFEYQTEQVEALPGAFAYKDERWW